MDVLAYALLGGWKVVQAVSALFLGASGFVVIAAGLESEDHS